VISPSFGLISVILYSFGLSFVESPSLSMLIAPVYLMIIKKDALFLTLKKMLFLNIFIVIMGLSAVINQDYEYAFLIILRANALILFTLLVFHEKTLFDIASALQVLKVPNKLVTLFFFVGKFVIIIKNEYEVTKKVMKVRNFRAKSSFFSYKIYANVIGMMIVKCFDRAEKLKYSMILRNFKGTIYQNRESISNKTDWLLLFSVILSLSLHIGEIYL